MFKLLTCFFSFFVVSFLKILFKVNIFRKENEIYSYLVKRVVFLV